MTQKPVAATCDWSTNWAVRKFTEGMGWAAYIDLLQFAIILVQYLSKDESQSLILWLFPFLNYTDV